MESRLELNLRSSACGWCSDVEAGWGHPHDGHLDLRRSGGKEEQPLKGWRVAAGAA